nr:D-amino acid dehydrogenase small subunit [uncultured bacterium]
MVDRQPGPGLETSFANGGQVSANHATPWANPAAPLKILKWLGREDSPLLFRLRADPAQWAWGLRFLANCTAAKARINTEKALRLALYSRECLAGIRAETGIEYDRIGRGILHIYRDAREFETALPQAELMSELGCRREPLDVAGCLAIEPALSASKDSLKGGILSPDDESGDAHLFTRRLADICMAKGVSFRFDTPVQAIMAEGGNIAGIATAAGTLKADRYVVALGSYGVLLLRPLGIRPAIHPVKGYSATIPIAGHGGAPTVSLIDDEYKMVYSRLGRKLRVAGTAEFAGFDASVTPSRAHPLLERAMALFPDCGDPEGTEFWAGLRPMTPDSVPVVGRTRFSNLFLNTGHGTLGWTMACGSGRAVADLATGGAPEVDLEGLGAERFL